MHGVVVKQAKATQGRWSLWSYVFAHSNVWHRMASWVVRSNSHCMLVENLAKVMFGQRVTWLVRPSDIQGHVLMPGCDLWQQSGWHWAHAWSRCRQPIIVNDHWRVSVVEEDGPIWIPYTSVLEEMGFQFLVDWEWWSKVWIWIDLPNSND